MMQEIGVYIKLVVAVALTLAILLSISFRMQSHDFTELAQIVSDHQDEIADHGHAHEDIVDLVHAYHSHGHEIADHDHNVAFLLPRIASAIAVPTRSNWVVAHTTLLGRNTFDLDRPPRG